MSYWQGTGVVDFLLLLMLLGGARQLFRSVPLIQRMAVPPVLVAGFIGLGLGEGGAKVLPMSGDVLETIVYHGLAVVFITMGLQRGSPARPRAASDDGLVARLRRAVRDNREAVSIAFAIPVFSMLQAMLGLLFVLAWTGALETLHPGLGLMLPLGFSQGPGQALSLGKAWEQMGMQQGAQVGLTMATIGYLWCSLLGVAFFHLGRRLGWDQDDPELAGSPGSPGRPLPEAGAVIASGRAPAPLQVGMEPLTATLSVIGLVYLGAWGLITLVTGHLDLKPQLIAMLWGFHYLFGLVLALSARSLIRRFARQDFVDDRLLARVSGLAVDLTAAGAIAAVRLDAVDSQLVPIVVLATLGVIMTGGGCLWLARRAWPRNSFDHALVMFGTMTGTLPTGLALLRLSDPELEGHTARNMVAGVTGATALAAPLLLVILPMPVMGWPESFPGAVWKALALVFAYTAFLVVVWNRIGALRFDGPLFSLWPRRSPPVEAGG